MAYGSASALRHPVLTASPLGGSSTSLTTRAASISASPAGLHTSARRAYWGTLVEVSTGVWIKSDVERTRDYILAWHRPSVMLSETDAW